MKYYIKIMKVTLVINHLMFRKVFINLRPINVYLHFHRFFFLNPFCKIFCASVRHDASLISVN